MSGVAYPPPIGSGVDAQDSPRLFAMKRSLTTLTTHRLDGRLCHRGGRAAVQGRHHRRPGRRPRPGRRTPSWRTRRAGVGRPAGVGRLHRPAAEPRHEEARLVARRQGAHAGSGGHLAKQLERLGLERRAKPVPDLKDYLPRRLWRGGGATIAETKVTVEPAVTSRRSSRTFRCRSSRRDDAGDGPRF